MSIEPNAYQEFLKREMEHKTRLANELIRAQQDMERMKWMVSAPNQEIVTLQNRMLTMEKTVTEYRAMAVLAKQIMISIGKDVSYLQQVCDRCVKPEGSMVCEKCPKLGFRETMQAIAQVTADTMVG